jgi:hypothetical protein
MEESKMANETHLKIKLADDGQYTIEIVEGDAKNGTRLDQQVAQEIVKMDQKLKDPQTAQAMASFRQNHQGMIQRMFSGMMPNFNNNMPWGGGGGMPGMNGFFGRGQ